VKLKKRPAPVNPIYAAMVEKTDESFGRIVETLERLDLTGNTLMVFTSDNGGVADVTDNLPLRAGKGFLYEGGMRVPLLARWLGKIEEGFAIDAPVIGTDLFATIAEAAGLTAASASHSRTLIPLLTGKTEALAGDLYWYYPHYSPQAQQPGAAIRPGKWKLIEHYDPPAVELYDLTTDSGETRDLAESRAEARARLLAKLHATLAEAGTLMHPPNPAFPQRAAP
jgi:arylsulfatase A-like enzyme